MVVPRRLLRPLLAAQQAAPGLASPPDQGPGSTHPARDVLRRCYTGCCYAKARCYRSFDENAVFNASSVATSALMPHWKFCRQLDKAMIHTSHRDRKARAIAEVLAMIDATTSVTSLVIVGFVVKRRGTRP
jgi:hypothetical protein